MHRTLARQLRKLGLSSSELPSPEVWASFLERINQAYTSNDEDRYLLERAMNISSSEMRALMETLAKQNNQLQAEIDLHAKTTQKLRYAATHDSLTGLPNRSTMAQVLGECLKQTEIDDGYQFAILFIDLDDFKLINDSLGHDVGDQVLVALADRLRTACEPIECLAPLVCRLGGDEFVILLRQINHRDDATNTANSIEQILDSPFVVANQNLVVSASVGLLIGDHSYREPAAMLRDADTAMYRAKISGKGRYTIFDSKMHDEMVDRLKTEQQIRLAIERREFMMVYQPIVDLETGQLSAFESLVRWQHPELGILSPAAFIGLAEETGLIIPIGRQIIRDVCLTIAQWDRSGVGTDHLKVCVNVSKRQLTESALFEDLCGACREAEIDPDRLIIEVTESSVMADPDHVTNVLAKIREFGFQVYMDDFGTGLSSLSTLQKMPFDAIKIDRSFIRYLCEKRENTAIVLSIVMLAHNLNLKVVAEGIEQVSQLTQIQACECDYGQGYLFASPLNKESVLDWIRSEKIQWEQLRCA